jgi:ABC-type iron transport system FetAB ATPase subunit
MPLFTHLLLTAPLCIVTSVEASIQRLISGPPGVGKSVLVQAVAELHPMLTNEQEGELKVLQSQALMQNERLRMQLRLYTRLVGLIHLVYLGE